MTLILRKPISHQQLNGKKNQIKVLIMNDFPTREFKS